MVNLGFSSLAFLMLPLVRGNPSGCVTDVADKDYFDHKVSPIESVHWSVSYHNTYKIVFNEVADETYLLYQCGTEPPQDQLDAGHAAIVKIPVEEAGLRYTTMIPFLELLGARMNIGAFFGQASWVSSPCLGQLLQDGQVETVPDATNATLITNVPLDLPSFIGHYDNGLAFTNTFRVSATEEEENLAVFEWIKFYSVFFNLEEAANDIFDDVRTRYECAEQNADLLACDAGTKPVVLWASYSAYCGGWSVANCPNYYCDFAEACSVTLLNSTEGSIQTDRCGSAKYMTTEEFVAFGKDADYWIYTSSDFQNTLTNFGADLQDFVSVQNQEVFDTEGRGGNAWFEQRLAEPDVVLQDFCDVVGFENPASLHQRAWLRNVYTEPTGSLGQCEDPAAPLITPGTECLAVPADLCFNSGTADGNSDGNGDPEVDGSIDGNGDPQVDGSSDGNGDPQVDGSSDGNGDPEVDGSIDGNGDPEVDGASEDGDGRDDGDSSSARNIVLFSAINAVVASLILLL